MKTRNLEQHIYVIEQRNYERGHNDWTLHHTKPFKELIVAQGTLRNVQNSYGHQGQEYRIAIYRRIHE